MVKKSYNKCSHGTEKYTLIFAPDYLCDLNLSLSFIDTLTLYIYRESRIYVISKTCLDIGFSFFPLVYLVSYRYCIYFPLRVFIYKLKTKRLTFFYRALTRKKINLLKISRTLKLTHPLSWYPCFWKSRLGK